MNKNDKIIMKILQITKYFYPNPGGIESHVLGIAEGLVKKEDNGKRNEVIVLASNHPKTVKFEIYNGIKIRRSSIFFTLFRDPFTPGMLIDLLFREDYDLIHLHLPDPFNSFFAFFASILKGKPLIVTYHADIIKDKFYHKLFKFLYNFFQDFLLLRHAKVIIATSPNYAQSSETLRKFKEKIKIVPNFVDTKKFNPNVNGKEIKKRYSLKNKKVILFLGRLIPYKGVEFLIKAFPKVKEKIKNSILVIAGDGPLKENLKALCGKRKDILFIKPKNEEIPKLFAVSDVFVLPSITRQEAFGIVLLEAMSSGVPCISTKISGMPFVIDDAGILVNPKNSKELSKAIIKILSNENLAKEFSKKARKRVEENFTIERVVEKLMKIYKICMS